MTGGLSLDFHGRIQYLLCEESVNSRRIFPIDLKYLVTPRPNDPAKSTSHFAIFVLASAMEAGANSN
jgi:hypothetical protein